MEGKLDPRQKKTTRDLSDLKSKLGLAKPAAQPAAPAAAAPAAPPPSTAGTGPVPALTGAAAASPLLAQMPAARPLATPGHVMPPGGVVPPHGVMPPGGYPQPAPQPPPPDPKRDPFAPKPVGYATGQQGYQAIVDAGPPIEIPKEKKSYTKLIIALVITAAVPLGVGWACGRIYGARILFNKGIDDARQIQEEVTKMAAVNKKVAEAIDRSQKRNQGKVIYDEKLVEELKDVLRASPAANPERARKQQEQLFRTNYAMMEGLVIDRLFNYYNNSIRLYAELEAFLQKSERTAELVKAYSPEVEKGGQKFGIVFAEDAGSYYLGQLVEVGNIDCAKPEAKECKKEDIKGFMVRVSGTGSWTPRIGKPATKKDKITDIVVPIIPDENWKKVAVGKKGYMEYKEYQTGIGRLAALSALIFRDEKPLIIDLGKAAGREKVFAPL